MTEEDSRFACAVASDHCPAPRVAVAVGAAQNHPVPVGERVQYQAVACGAPADVAISDIQTFETIGNVRKCDTVIETVFPRASIQHRTVAHWKNSKPCNVHAYKTNNER
jgi:hypothetical protein